ncbi:MAG: hypothetical protein RMJ48_05720 [Roseiflexaceae bacterium]|nr:hypothetical protein [Roseiflexaceae bacterium]
MEKRIPIAGSIARVISILAVAVGLMLSAGVARAQDDIGVPGGPFSTAFRVQNLGGSNANCNYVLYKADGTQAFQSSLPAISPGTSAYIYTPAVTGLPSGLFSAVILCDQQVAAVVNYSDPDSGDTYIGVSSPANTLFVPSIYNNFFDYYTSLRIMNASNSANSVRVEYFKGANKIGEDTIPLQGNGSATVKQEGKSFLSPDVDYSAKITGTGPLAAMVQIYGRVGSPVQDQLYSFTAFSSGAPKAYVPLVMSNFFGYNTATTVQNAGSAQADVKVTYSNGRVETFSLAPGASKTLVDFLLLPSSSSVYSAVVENTGANPQPLIVTVNESRSGTKLATTYEGFVSGAKNWVAPIVMKNYFGYESSITCQNIGAGPATISISYQGEGPNNTQVNVPSVPKITNLPVNQSGVVVQFGEAQLPSGFIGSAEISSTQDVICVVNQSDQSNPNKDLLFAYNAIPKP